MKFNKIITIPTFLLFLVIFSSCEKEVGPLSDIKPAVVVTVPNAIAYRPEPTVSTPLPTVAAPSSTITITLSIPSTSPVKIKEITKVAANTSYAAIQGTGTTIGGTSGFYSLTPIPAAADGLSVTFTTTTSAYLALYPATLAANAELARRFYFLLTMVDGSKVIPESVRVLVL